MKSAPQFRKAGRITIGQATREMRKTVGMNQNDSAEKVLGIFPRVLLYFENDRGNPTLETLQKIAEPFGLKVGFIRPTPIIFNVSINNPQPQVIKRARPS